MELAKALELRGRAAEALPEADLAIALDPKDPGAHLAKARSLSRAKRFDEADAEFGRAEALFVEANSAVGRATADRQRGDSQYLRARYAQADELYQKAAKTFASAGLEMLAAQSRKATGDCALMQGNLEAAVAIYEPILALARSAGDHRTVVATLSSLGGQYIVRGRFDLAERALREARTEAMTLGNPALTAGPTLNLASVLGSTGRWGESHALADEALGMAREVGDYQVQAKALLLLANAQYWDGHLDEALRSYREVRDSQPLANAPGAPLGNVHLGLAQILRDTGRLKEALASAEQAVAVNRSGNQRVLLGYSLVERARILADLGLDAAAESNLDEASNVATNPAPPLDDLLRIVALGRAALAASRSRWDDAERALAPLRESIAIEHPQGSDVSVLALSARVAFARGRMDEASRFAARAIAHPTGSAVDRTRSRVELARVDARSGKRAAAGTEARRGLDEAERMGSPVVTALASSVLLELGEGVDLEAIRARGHAALERFLDAAPDDRRDALRARNDLKTTFQVLEGNGAATQSR